MEKTSAREQHANPFKEVTRGPRESTRDRSDVASLQTRRPCARYPSPVRAVVFLVCHARFVVSVLHTDDSLLYQFVSAMCVAVCLSHRKGLRSVGSWALGSSP